MNTHSIHSSISPSQFLTRKSNHFNRIRDAENPGAQQSRPEKNQPGLTRNPGKIVENQIVRGIEKAMGSDGISSAKINALEFTPEKVAGRILAFVNKAYGQLQNNDPNFDQAKFFSQIKQGIETGFSEARDALDKLGVLDGQPKQNLDATYTKIQEGLSKLAGGARAPAAAQLQGFAARVNQSAEIEIVTKEGDLIKIRLEQSAAVSQSSVHIGQDGITVNAFKSSSETSSEFSVTVDGNLNEDEQKSLKELLKKMNGVGHDFFNGNIQAAFKHAQKIGLDTGQIASFSMSLSMEKSVQAVAAYQQAAFPDRKIEPEKIKQAADFFSQARDMLKTAQSALGPFENPLSAFNALFNAVHQVGIEKSTEPKITQGNPLLQQLIKPLGEAILVNGKPAPV
jgi:hypothetical protein